MLIAVPWRIGRSIHASDDLDPAAVPFRKRSVTILRRTGFFDDRSLFNTLSEEQVLS